MTLVRDLLERKPGPVATISPKSTVFAALELMAERDVGALVVVAGDRVVGIFSERDYARKVILSGKSSKTECVQELMSSRVYFVRPETSVEDCMALMTEKRIRHLPVMEKDRLVGIVSIGDAVNDVIHRQKHEIRDLERFITGGYPQKR